MTVGGKPPVARKDRKTVEIHGTTLVDDYGWMREKTSPEVLEYLNAENAYTASAMAGTEELQSKLYAEMLSHIKETDESVPYRRGEWFYFTQTFEGKQYPVHCRKQSLEAEAQVFLDVNALAEGQAFMDVGGMTASPDGWLLAYSTETQDSGSTHCTCGTCGLGRTWRIRRSGWVRLLGRRTPQPSSTPQRMR